jgi:hypothetical protein
MTTLTEGIHQGEHMISEANGMRSRDQVTVLIAGAVAYRSGTVLGKVTASGKYVKYDNAASDGSQTATGVLLTPLLDGVNGDYKAVMHARDCEVIGAKLNNGVALDAPGLVDLAALGIVVR